MDLDVSALSHDQAVVRDYHADRLVHNRMSARIYHQLLAAAEQVLDRPLEVQVPTLLLYGEADRIVSIETANRWFHALSCQKRLVSFPGTYHELHHEDVCGEVVRLTREWLTSP